MKEEQRLLNLDLQKEQKRQGINQKEGIKLYLFRALYSLLKYYGLNHFCDILFTVLSFVQLMAFPMDTVFSSGWKNFWYNTIGSFFRYFQLVPLWGGNSQFFIITYIITCLYFLILLIAFLHILMESTSLSYRSQFSNRLITSFLEFEIILSIPFLRTLFAVFTCENDILVIAPDFKCHRGVHICLMIISIFFILIYIFLNFIFYSTLFEFGANNSKLKSAYTSSTQVLLEIIKLILIILYQFIKNEMVLSIITFILSLILLIDFFNKQPFSNGLTMKLYWILYLIFFWSCTICLIAILLKNSKFEGGVILLLIGYPMIILATSTNHWEYDYDKIFKYSFNNNKDGYKALLEIEFFLKLEESLEDKIRTREHKILYSYINNYERSCTLANCPLKQFLNIPLKVENFVEMKVCLLQHAEMLYKAAVSKYPFNAKLRISYGLFLYNKLNKKLKGTNEISLLNKYNTNLEESFLIYKAQRFIQEENEGIASDNDDDIDPTENVINSVSYKLIINNIKSLISKITMNYIDFWTILAISDENKSENFQKMSKLGTKIRKLNEELLQNVEKLENVNLYDQDIFKLYIQYLTEILSNHNQAISYTNKLSENENKKHQYNEENLYELNYKAMSKSEDYKYIIINCSSANFDTICNVSSSICPIFGYTKEELVGHPFDYLLPELFCIHHKQMLRNKVDEFKRKLLTKNVKTRGNPWFDDSFGRNKMKYLIPFKARWTLVSSEEEIIYGIGKIIAENKSLADLEQEIVYVLTDKDLIIQSFTANAPKLLLLHSSAINNNLDITDYIREFNEDYISFIDNNNDEKESNISTLSITSKKKVKNIKIEILKKMFLNEKDTKRIIHWKLVDIYKNELNKAKKSIFAKRTSLSKINFNDAKFQSAFIENTGKKKQKKAIIKKKVSLSSTGLETIDSPRYKKLNSSNTEEKLPTMDKEIEKEKEKIFDIKDSNICEINELINDKNSKDKVYYHRPIHHRFSLVVTEVKLNEYKVGYLFKFEPFNSKALDETNISKANKNQMILKHELSSMNKPDMNEMDKSEISVMSFANKPLEQRNSFIVPTVDNPFGISCENNDTFYMKLNNEKENEFTIDLKNMAYRQFGLNCMNDKSEENALYELLRQEAVEKISKVAKQVKKEETSEEEEESSSGSYYSSEENSRDNSDSSSGRKEDESSHHSIKDALSHEITPKRENNGNIGKKNNSVKESNKNIPVLTNIPSTSKNNNYNLGQLTNLNNQKHKEEEYYHVNMNNITYYIYNYTTGFVEAIKDQKYKQGQVAKQINSEKEKLSKMNAKYIANPKLAKEKKRGNISKKITNDEDESNSFSEKTMKLKEIQKALTSKEKQSSIINLCLFSFIIFALVIGTSIMSIMINFYLKNKTYMFYSLIRKSIELYKNILFEITFVREMLIINSTYYNNYYDNDQNAYYSDYRKLCYKYYLDTGYILSNLTINLNTLNEQQRSIITNKAIDLYILDPMESEGINYKPKNYQLLVYSAYRELNAALYHISKLREKEIYTYEDNVYYFIKNGMSNLIISSEDQIHTLTDEFYSIVNTGHLIIIICLAILLFLYIGCFLIFKHFYEKVEERKQSYLSVFYEIGGQFIILSLTKCERFSQKLQIQEDMVGAQGEKISLNSSSSDESYIDNDIQASSIIKQNKDKKINNNNKEKSTKSNSFSKIKITGFIIFFMLLICQYSSYIYYYERISLYKNCIHYEYYLTKYMSSFLFPFIGIREFIYDPKKTFYNLQSEIYIDDTLKKFYVELANVSDYKDRYINYFPKSYTNYLNYLYSDKICEIIQDFIKQYPYNGYNGCDDFFYGTSDYGFFSILTTYIEEIRYLRDTVKEYIVLSNQKGYIYNESFLNDPNNYYENIIYANHSDDDYRDLNPANTLNTTSHKTLFIVYRFIISRVMILALESLFSTFDGIFASTTKVSLIINIIFMLIVFIGFCMIWLPFILQENETIFKTKNMLSIIPNEILISLPHINFMLGIDEDSG